MNSCARENVLPGSNTGGLIPESGDTSGMGSFWGSPASADHPLARWAARDRAINRERHYSRQAATLGAVADLLDWGVDTVHYHVAVDHPTLRAMVGRCRAWVDAGARRDVIEGGINGYSFTILCADGLKVYCSSGKNLDMGLWIVAGAGWCLQRPVQEIEWSIIDSICSIWDVEPDVLRLRLRRVDVRFDFKGERLQPYAELGHMICRARTHRKMHDQKIPCETYGTVARWTGVTAGKGDVRARFYDKLAELEQSEPGLVERWQAVWGYDGDSVYRLEYQLRGDVLSEYQIEKMHDLVAVLGDVVSYLLDWLRFAEIQARKDVDRPLLPWWAAIVETINLLDFAQCGAVRDVVARKPDVDGLRAQLLGLFSTWFAAVEFVNGGGGGDWDHMEAVSRFFLEVEGERKTLGEKYFDKIQYYRLTAMQ